jgi:hypothetical protein
MAGSILVNGARMGVGTGWFGPGQSRFTWDTRATQHDADADGQVTPAEFGGTPADFARLDRDASGALTRDDLDWSPQSPFMRRIQAGRARFNQLDANANGKLTREEFDRLFNRAAAGKDHLTLDDMTALLADLATPPEAGRRARAAQQPAASAAQSPKTVFRRSYDYLFAGPEGAPSRWTLLKGLASSEIGSLFEGPALATAPSCSSSAASREGPSGPSLGPSRTCIAATATAPPSWPSTCARPIPLTAGAPRATTAPASPSPSRPRTPTARPPPPSARPTWR